MNTNVCKRCFNDTDECSDDYPPIKKRRLIEYNKNETRQQNTQARMTVMQENKCDKNKMDKTKCAQGSKKRVFNDETNMDDCGEPLMKRPRLSGCITSINGSDTFDDYQHDCNASIENIRPLTNEFGNESTKYEQQNSISLSSYCSEDESQNWTNNYEYVV